MNANHSALGPTPLVKVRDTQLLASDTRESRREKIARITLDSMVQFVGLLDASGTVLEINQVALDGVGIKLSDVEGRPFWTTFWWQVSDEINATLRESIRRAAQGEFVRWDTEIYGRASGKETIIIDASLMPVRDENGEVVFIAAEGRDITEKKAYEREIARQREELAQLDELKTQFFANVSHEFRTPLTLMLGPLENLLSRDGLPREAHDEVATAHRNSLRLLKLVNSLLDFSRIQAGRMKASYAPVDLSALTVDLTSHFRSAMQAAGVDLRVDCQPLGELVYVDNEMWEKVVLNLLSNAFKFTFDGYVSVRLEAIDGNAVLTVEDTGVGIPEAELALIFERFHRVEGAKGRTYEGSGIGLALIQDLVKLHGGSVTVSSRVGKGSAFRVSIPLGSKHLPIGRVTQEVHATVSTADRPEAYTQEAMTWLTPSGGTPASNDSTGHRPSILVVDDNADMREHLLRILGATFGVLAVTNGIEALEAIKNQKPAMIVADVMMPRLDGFGLLRELRADADLRDLPVLLLSARAGEEARTEGINAGADDYLTKPFSANELLARVNTTLALQRNRQEAQAQFEALLDHAPLGIYLVDADFRIRHVNPTAREVFGDIPGLVGRDFSEIIHILWTKEHADEIIFLFRKTLETGEPQAIPEWSEHRADRQARETYEWRVNRIPLPDGRFGVVCYFREISEQVKARTDLARSEGRYRAFVTSTSDVIYVMNPDWSEMRHLQGRDFIADMQDPSRGWIEKYIDPIDQPRVLATIRQAIETKSIFELEHRVIRLDGSVGWTFSRGIPLLDNRGELVEWFGTARDVTDRKQSEEKIALLTAQSERQRRLYETILSETPDFVYVFDLDHSFIYANDSLVRMFGQEAIGKHFLQLGYPDWHAEKHDREIDQVIATKQSIRGEVPFTGTNGSRIYDYIFVPVFGPSGNVEAVAGTTRDVTDRKMIEEELRRANADLEQFAYTASHDLKEPLRSIMIFSELLTNHYRDKLDGQALEFFDHVRNGAQRMEMLVRDLLNYTQTSTLPVLSEPTDANEALRGVIEDLGGTIVEAEAQIEVETLPSVRVHSTHLQQLFLNLLGNGIKYRRAGVTPALRVSARPTASGWEFCVSDNGIGIAPEYREQVFGLFKRLHADQYSGTGLGLAICQRIVERYNGRIWVESELGRGSRFYFFLPL